jgi:hypothetical protein
MAPARDEDVGRLDVAMYDAFGVCCVEPVCDLDSQRQKSFGFHRPPRNVVLEGEPVEKFHHNKSAAVVFSEVVHSANIRMIQRRCGAGLAA